MIWREQIAVVTGGAGGLGWLVAKILELKGAEVVVWDIRAPEEWDEQEGGVKWYKVDVGDADAVETAYQRVVEEVCSAFLLHLQITSFHFQSKFQKYLKRGKDT